MKLYVRSLFIITFMWSIVFAIGMALVYIYTTLYGEQLGPMVVIGLTVGFAFLMVFLQYLISPWIMDFTLEWIYDLNKYPVDALPSHLRDFLYQQMEAYNFSLKWVAIINDNNPNAFVYGHTKKRARMVLTNGILTLLDEDEQIAVVAHECGHIVHNDFIWMTVAAAIPLICYSFYQGLMSFARTASYTSSSSDDDTMSLGLAAFIVAVMAYIAYWISHFLVLLLSRVREYYADEHSAEVTGQPGALSRALVKIAYGMVKADTERDTVIRDKKANPTLRKSAAKQKGFTTGIRALGIFDAGMARSLALAAYGTGASELNSETVAKAASWDLNHPWAGFLEFFSTHPLPAKRILALNKMQEKRGQRPEFPDVGTIKPPESLWDEFLIDLFLMYVAPSLWFILPIVGATVAALYNYNILIGLGIGCLLFALVWKWRRREKYPKIHNDDPVVSVVHCLTDMTKNSYYESSPLRGKPAVLEGEVIGRGTPGYWLSEDLVIRDDTGILTLDYSPILGFMSFFFALFRVPSLIGTRVKVYGWYHRTPTPLLQVWKIEAFDRVYKNRWSGLNWLLMWFFIIVGLALIVLGFYP